MFVLNRIGSMSEKKDFEGHCYPPFSHRTCP
jgi:hypothetical protein